MLQTKSEFVAKSRPELWSPNSLWELLLPFQASFTTNLEVPGQHAWEINVGMDWNGKQTKVVQVQRYRLCDESDPGFEENCVLLSGVVWCKWLKNLPNRVKSKGNAFTQLWGPRIGLLIHAWLDAEAPLIKVGFHCHHSVHSVQCRMSSQGSVFPGSCATGKRERFFLRGPSKSLTGYNLSCMSIFKWSTEAGEAW